MRHVEKKQLKLVYDTIADSWSNVRNRPFRFVVEYSSQIKGKKVLEVGCGAGAQLLQFAKNNFVVGLDFSRKMIYHARKSFKKKNVEGYFVVSDALFPAIRSNSFDVVLAIALLHHIPGKKNRIKVIKELLRIAKKEVLISVWKRRFKIAGVSLFKSFILSLFKLREYGDVYVSWNYHGKKIKRFYHLYSFIEFINDLKEAGVKKYFVFEDCKGNIVAKIYK